MHPPITWTLIMRLSICSASLLFAAGELTAFAAADEVSAEANGSEGVNESVSSWDIGANPPKVEGVSSCDDSAVSPLAFGSKMDFILEMRYPGGVQDCGAALTISQAADAPTIKMKIVDSKALYTVLMLDTTVSEVHPILHFGAVNVAGARLKEGLKLSDMDPFSDYRGPAPPPIEMMPGIERIPFNYELVVAAQLESVEKPVIDSPMKFDYDTFLTENTVGAKIASYYTTGHCVDASGDDIADDTDMPTEIGNGMDIPNKGEEGDDTSAGYYVAVLNTIIALPLFALALL